MCAGITCPRAGKDGEKEAFADEALNYTKSLVYQHDVCVRDDDDDDDDHEDDDDDDDDDDVLNYTKSLVYQHDMYVCMCSQSRM